MRRVKLFFLLPIAVAALCMTAAQAYAALDREQAEHAASALFFAKRNDWDDALLHAKRSQSAILSKLITWQYLQDPSSGASFEEIDGFLAKNPHWPAQKKLRIRAEQMLREARLGHATVAAWFGDAMPITGAGKLALAKALAEDSGADAEKIDYLIRDAWRNGDFDESIEEEILAQYGPRLRKEDFISRVDRLLWEEKTVAAQRVLPHLAQAQQQLVKTRIALIAGKQTAPLMVMQLPVNLKRDPGLLFDRMRWRARRDDDSGVREILLSAPGHVPYPAKWWRYREQQVRKAIDEKKYAMATRLLANHAQEEGVEYADAIWLSGWLHLEFLRKPQDAYKQFYAMYSAVRYPVSRARAAYWAGRAALESGDEDASRTWYQSAAAHPTTFYGQLAAAVLTGAAPLRLPAEPVISQEAQRAFEQKDLVRAIRLVAELGEANLASQLMHFLIEQTDDPVEAALAAKLGGSVHKTYLSVRASKKALQQNVVLVATGYPRVPLPDGLPIERPLALAIMRQESEFDPFAKSSAGALGLMQLMPATAKETARKLGLPFAQSRLYEPHYNARLGSAYLERLLNSYDGSYIMAIAAYNAGPGNVRDWTAAFGTPGGNTRQAINWIEKIPFAETRNYVQRVLENLQVYRHLEAGGVTPNLLIERDMSGDP